MRKNASLNRIWLNHFTISMLRGLKPYVKQQLDKQRQKKYGEPYKGQISYNEVICYLMGLYGGIEDIRDRVGELDLKYLDEFREDMVYFKY